MTMMVVDWSFCWRLFTHFKITTIKDEDIKMSSFVLCLKGHFQILNMFN